MRMKLPFGPKKDPKEEGKENLCLGGTCGVPDFRKKKNLTVPEVF